MRKFDILMWTLFIITGIMLLCRAHASEMKRWDFQYRINGQTYVYVSEVTTWSKAHEEGAIKCYYEFVKNKGDLTENDIAEITSICANPK